MKSKPLCIICSLKQAFTIIEKITKDPVIQKQMLDKSMDYLTKQDLDNITPAELASDLYHIICRELNSKDPFRPDMNFYNRQGVSLYPKLQKILDESEDRLFTALLVAVAGNIIDLGIVDKIDVEETISGVLTNGLKYSDYKDFRSDLAKANSLLYLPDNAGEIAFDRILVEEIHREFSHISLKIAVKKEPVVNDALREDAAQVGLDKFGDIIDTGAAELGVPKDRCHPDFWQTFYRTDMVIAKGHANYETLEVRHKALYVILRAKCPIVAKNLGVDVHDSVLKKIK